MKNVFLRTLQTQTISIFATKSIFPKSALPSIGSKTSTSVMAECSKSWNDVLFSDWGNGLFKPYKTKCRFWCFYTHLQKEQSHIPTYLTNKFKFRIKKKKIISMCVYIEKSKVSTNSLIKPSINNVVGYIYSSVGK